MNGSSSTLAARLGAAIGAEFFPKLFGDVPTPSEVTALFLPFTEALAQFALEALGGTKEARQRAVLAALFPPQDKSEPASGPEADNLLIGRAVRLIGRLLSDIVLTPDPQPVPDQGGLAEPINPGAWLKELQRVADARKLSDLFDALKQSGLFDGLSPKAGTLAPFMYSEQRVLEILRAMARLLDALGRFRRCADYLEAEVPRLVRRSAIAAAFAGVADQVPFYVKSNPEIGRTVHKKLQDDYLRVLGPVHEIVVEQFDGKSAELYVWLHRGRLNKRVPLAEAALNPAWNADGFFFALRAAMVSAKLNTETWLRADLVDADSREIWEIKPVAGAVTGVWQEALYRVGTNLMLFFLSPSPRLLNSGGFWPVSPLGNLGRLVYVHPLIELASSAKPTIALPFQASVLDGLVLYAVFRYDFIKELFEAVKLFFVLTLKAAREASKRLGEVARQIAQILEELGRRVAEVAGYVLAACVVVILVLAVLATLPEDILLAIGLAIVEFGAAAINIIWPKLQQIQGALGAAAPPPTVDLRLGPLTVYGVPSDQAGAFLTGVFGRLNDLGQRLTAKLEGLVGEALTT